MQTRLTILFLLLLSVVINCLTRKEKKSRQMCPVKLNSRNIFVVVFILFCSEAQSKKRLTRFSY